MMISSKRVNPAAATALCYTMPLSNRDRLTRELWLLRCELAEIRAQAAAQRRWAALGRAEARSVCEERNGCRPRRAGSCRLAARRAPLETTLARSTYPVSPAFIPAPVD